MFVTMNATSKGYSGIQVYDKVKPDNIIKGSKLFIKVYGKNEVIPLSNLWTGTILPEDFSGITKANIKKEFLPGEYYDDDLVDFLRGEPIEPTKPILLGGHERADLVETIANIPVLNGKEEAIERVVSRLPGLRDRETPVYVRYNGVNVRIETELYALQDTKNAEGEARQEFFIDKDGNYIPVEEILPPAYKIVPIWDEGDESTEKQATYIQNPDTLGSKRSVIANLLKGESYTLPMISVGNGGNKKFYANQTIWAHDGKIYAYPAETYDEDKNSKIFIYEGEPSEENNEVKPICIGELKQKETQSNLELSGKLEEQKGNSYTVRLVNADGKADLMTIYHQPKNNDGSGEEYLELRRNGHKLRFTKASAKLNNSKKEQNIVVDDIQIAVLNGEIKINLRIGKEFIQLKDGRLSLKDFAGNELDYTVAFSDKKLYGLDFSASLGKEDYEELGFARYKESSIFERDEQGNVVADESGNPILNADILQLSKSDENGMVKVGDFAYNDYLINVFLENIQKLREKIAFLEASGSAKDLKTIEEINKEIEKELSAIEAVRERDRLVKESEENIQRLKDELKELNKIAENAPDDEDLKRQILEVQGKIAIEQAKLADYKSYNNISGVMEMIKKYQANKFPTFYVDKNGNVVRIEDLKTYEIGSNLPFNWSQDLAIKSILGKDKILNHKPTKLHPDGYCQVQFNENTKEACFRLLDVTNAALQLSFGMGVLSLFVAPLAIPTALVTSVASGAIAVAENIRKNIKQAYINNLTPQKVKDKEIEKIKDQIEKEIRHNAKLRKEKIKDLKRTIADEDELNNKIEEVNQEYKRNFGEAISKVNLLHDTVISSKYSLKDKKITSENFFGRLAYKQEREALRKGKNGFTANKSSVDLKLVREKAKEEYEKQLAVVKKDLKDLKGSKSSLADIKDSINEKRALKARKQDLKIERDDAINVYLSENGPVIKRLGNLWKTRESYLKKTKEYQQATPERQKEMLDGCKAKIKSDYNEHKAESVTVKGLDDEFVEQVKNRYIRLYNDLTDDNKLKYNEEEVNKNLINQNEKNIQHSSDYEQAENHQTKGQKAYAEQAEQIENTINACQGALNSSEYEKHECYKVKSDYEHLPKDANAEDVKKVKDKVTESAKKAISTATKGLNSIIQSAGDKKQAFIQEINDNIETELSSMKKSKELLGDDLDVFTDIAYTDQDLKIIDKGERTEKPFEEERRLKVLQALKNMTPVERKKYIEDVQQSDEFAKAMANKNKDKFNHLVSDIVGDDKDSFKELTSDNPNSREAIAELYYRADLGTSEEQKGRYSSEPTMEEKLINMARHLQSLSSEEEIKEFIKKLKNNKDYKQLKIECEEKRNKDKKDFEQDKEKAKEAREDKVVKIKQEKEAEEKAKHEDEEKIKTRRKKNEERIQEERNLRERAEKSGISLS